MTLLNEGLNKVANELSSLVTVGQYGTGTTLPSFTDTGLETAVGASSKSLTSAASGPSFTLTHSLSSTEANSNTFTEFITDFADSSTLTRSVFEGVTKQATIELTTITTINIIRGG